jgi:predicted KAP-like P-loop ATPase
MNKREKIIIDDNDPFYNDKFNREKTAQELSEVLSKVSAPFILMLNGKGGSGKSTFADMWKQELINFGNNTLKHNAFKNEYSENPLVSLLSELIERINDIQKGEKIPPTIKWNFKTISESIDEFSNNSVDNKIKWMERFEKKKDAIAQIQKSMSSILTEYYASEDGKFTPLYYFIDELDKCKSAFVVEMLNTVSRVLNIPEIIFIVAADKSQIENAVKTIYGNDFDTDNYLKNTFNLIYNLDEEQKS